MAASSSSSSQLFTEYGRLAMDEIFLKPFQVRERFDALILDMCLIVFVAVFDVF